MHALVTGAGGFLGRYIVEALLARGDRVRGLARGEYPQLQSLGVEMVRGDLADRDTVTFACQGIDCVFHVASRVGIWGPWREYYASNVVGTENVIDACRASGVGRLVFTSSPSVTFDGQRSMWRRRIGPVSGPVAGPLSAFEGARRTGGACGG